MVDKAYSRRMTAAGTDARATLKVMPQTWERLNSLKRVGDTMDAVINRLLDQAERTGAPAEPPK